MNHRIKYRYTLLFLLLLNLIGIFLMGQRMLNNYIPNEIKISVDEMEKFNFSLPIEAGIDSEDVDALNVSQGKIEKNAIHFNWNTPFTIQSSKAGNYKINLKLFGLIQLKQVDLQVIKNTKVIPSGMPIGIYIKTDGILVLGTGMVQGADGLNYEPALNILKSGDYIVAINSKEIATKKELMASIQESKGQKIDVRIRRGEVETNVTITPILALDGYYKIGTWVRNDTQGIGTLTYITEDNEFGALGHGVTDVDTDLLMDISEGAIYRADILQIERGEDGKPGELVGTINLGKKNKLGLISSNTEQGIFGSIGNLTSKMSIMNKPMSIAFKQDVKLGAASILCCVDGEIKSYDIQIEKISLNTKNHSKGLVICITDQQLLSKTNGIVQGMSGSPIIQDNKLIGAVTHVFIQDCTKGYGIFIENMLENEE